MTVKKHQWTAFLETFRKSGNRSTACRVAGISRQTLYARLKHDEGFAADFKEACVEAGEFLEEAALNRALGYETMREKHEILRDRRGNAVLDDEGRPRMVVTERVRSQEYDSSLLKTLLSAAFPDKYRERRSVEHSGHMDITLTQRQVNRTLALARTGVRDITPEMLDDEAWDIGAIDRQLARVDAEPDADPEYEGDYPPGDFGLPADIAGGRNITAREAQQFWSEREQQSTESAATPDAPLD